MSNTKEETKTRAEILAGYERKQSALVTIGVLLAFVAAISLGSCIANTNMASQERGLGLTVSFLTLVFCIVAFSFAKSQLVVIMQARLEDAETTSSN